MERSTAIGLSILTGLSAIGSGLYYYFYVHTATSLALKGASAIDPISNVADTVIATVAGWKSVQQGAVWLPYLNRAEDVHGLPADLLARIAYEESHFREEIIRGTKKSSAGAVGIMQLEPAYYPSAKAGIPFTDDDVRNQIDDAAVEMVHLYGRFSQWDLAIAAYNAGEGNVHKYGGVPPFPETQKYVADITADVGLA